VDPRLGTHAELQGGRNVHLGGEAGQGSGEGPGTRDAPMHKVKIYNRFTDEEVEVEVPEDRWVGGRAGGRTLCAPATSAGSVPAACGSTTPRTTWKTPGNRGRWVERTGQHMGRLK